MGAEAAESSEDSQDTRDVVDFKATEKGKGHRDAEDTEVSRNLSPETGDAAM